MVVAWAVVVRRVHFPGGAFPGLARPGRPRRLSALVESWHRGRSRGQDRAAAKTVTSGTSRLLIRVVPGMLHSLLITWRRFRLTPHPASEIPHATNYATPACSPCVPRTPRSPLSEPGPDLAVAHNPHSVVLDGTAGARRKRRRGSERLGRDHLAPAIPGRVVRAQTDTPRHISVGRHPIAAHLDLRLSAKPRPASRGRSRRMRAARCGALALGPTHNPSRSGRLAKLGRLGAILPATR